MALYARRELGRGKVENIVRENLGQISSMNEFNALRCLHPSQLTEAQRSQMRAIRDAIPDPQDGEAMVKVMSPLEFADLSDLPKKVSSFAAKKADLLGLIKPSEIIRYLRLDYANSNFMDKGKYIEKIYIIEFTKSRNDIVIKPYSKEIGGDGSIINEYPNTGNGFTSNIDGKVLPEYYITYRQLLGKGSTLYEITENNEILIKKIFDGKNWIDYINK